MYDAALFSDSALGGHMFFVSSLVFKKRRILTYWLMIVIFSYSKDIWLCELVIKKLNSSGYES